MQNLEIVGENKPGVACRAIPHVRFRLDAEQSLVYPDGDSPAATLSNAAADLLAHCGSFKNSEAHACDYLIDEKLRGLSVIAQHSASPLARRVARRLDRFLRRRIRSGPTADLQPRPQVQMIAALADQKLIEYEPDVVDRCCFAPLENDAAPRVAITTVAIPTRNRPEMVARALRSYLGNKPDNRQCDYLVIDSSDRYAGIGRLAASLTEQMGSKVWYAGPQARAEYAERLAKAAEVDPEIARFALLGLPDFRVTTGAGRNCILLQCCGEAVLQVDDDTLCDVAPAPEMQGGLRLSDRPFPFDDWFEAGAWAKLRFCEVDYLTAHETLLGATLPALVRHSRDAGAPVDLSGIGVSMRRRLTRGQGHIAATMSGYFGDCAQHTTLGYLLLEDESWSRLTATRRTYRNALTSRRILRATSRLSVSERPFCLSLNLGLDNTRLLPPFLPVLRNQDGVFAATLRAVRPDYYFGYLPYVIRHDWIHKKASNLDEIWAQDLNPRFCDLLLALIACYRPPSSPAVTAIGLSRLAEHLHGIASLSQSAFEDFVRMRWSERLAAELRWIERREYEVNRQPAYWSADIGRYQSILVEKLRSARGWLPSDFDHETQAETKISLSRQLVSLYAGLLSAWPRLMEGAKLLRGRGIRLAR